MYNIMYFCNFDILRRPAPIKWTPPMVGVRGGARTGYLIPGCDGDGAWTQPENSSAVAAVVVAAARPQK